MTLSSLCAKAIIVATAMSQCSGTAVSGSGNSDRTRTGPAAAPVRNNVGQSQRATSSASPPARVSTPPISATPMRNGSLPPETARITQQRNGTRIVADPDQHSIGIEQGPGAARLRPQLDAGRVEGAEVSIELPLPGGDPKNKNR
jgi:hypothetical protein